jgi:hypothetical protein
MGKAAAALKSETSMSSSSGEWMNGSGAGIDDDDDDEVDEHTLKQEPVTPLRKKSITSVNAVVDAQKAAWRQGTGTNSTETFLTAEEEEELRIPGSFDMSNPQRGNRSGSTEDDEDDEDESWIGFFKRMGLKS